MPTSEANPTPQSTPSVTFVSCVEAGGLEDQTIRMVQSLRRWGGRLANAPVYAVKPERGRPISARTLDAFDRLNVNFLDLPPKHQFQWYHFLNKPVTVAAACARATTDTVAWLDSDLLIVDEPSEYELPNDVDFTAASTDQNIGSTGPADPNDPFWRALGRTMDVDIDTLPWVVTQREKLRIRLYYNAGIFAVRRQSSYAEAYLENCLRALRAHVAHRTSGVYFLEQIIFAMTVQREQLRWSPMPYELNFPVASFLADSFDPAAFARAKVVHYHDALSAPFFDRFAAYFDAPRPEVAEWLRAAGPLQGGDSGGLVRSLTRLSRAMARDAHLMRCQKY